MNLAANLLLGACVVAALFLAARGTVRAVRRYRATPSQDALDASLCRHPAASMRGPSPRDGEPLSPAEKRAWTRIADRFADDERMTRAQEIRDGIGEDR